VEGKFQTTSYLLTFERRVMISPAVVPKPAHICSLLEIGMPYGPVRDAPCFPTRLKRRAEVERLTNQVITHPFNEPRTRGDRLSISRASLDRFIHGEDTTKTRDLRVIHDTLRAHRGACRVSRTGHVRPDQ
jgi:hypothetical protein